MTPQICKLMLLATLGWGAACGPSFHQPTPKNFVKLKDQERYSYRAVTADGLVYAVKELEHSPKGDLNFWTKAVENKLRFQTGYALLHKTNVATSGGLQGMQLQFGFDRGKTPHLYYVTVFTTDDHIFVLEAGGAKDLMDAHKVELDAALKSFRLD